MIKDIKTSIDKIVGNMTSLATAKGAGRAFELYIMTSIALELKNKGCTVSVQRSDETLMTSSTRDRKFIQRASGPSGIVPKAIKNGPTTFLFQIPKSEKEWEIWNGTQFIGRSDAKHEIDVAIVPHEIGCKLRDQLRGGCPRGRPMVAIECKDVISTGTPDEMRCFLARLYDLTILDGHRDREKAKNDIMIADNIDSNFWYSNRNNYAILARKTGFSTGALAMTDYYGIKPEKNITHASHEHQKMIDECVKWIMNTLK